MIVAPFPELFNVNVLLPLPRRVYPTLALAELPN